MLALPQFELKTIINQTIIIEKFVLKDLLEKCFTSSSKTVNPFDFSISSSSALY